jgi:hypothetical protein
VYVSRHLLATASGLRKTESTWISIKLLASRGIRDNRSSNVPARQ